MVNPYTALTDEALREYLEHVEELDAALYEHFNRKKIPQKLFKPVHGKENCFMIDLSALPRNHRLNAPPSPSFLLYEEMMNRIRRRH